MTGVQTCALPIWGMYMGESDSTDRNRQNLSVDRILGFRAGEVKKKSPGSILAPKDIILRALPHGSDRERVCKTCGKAFRGVPVSGLTARNLEAYSLPLVDLSKPRTIMALSSSFCHIFR